MMLHGKKGGLFKVNFAMNTGPFQRNGTNHISIGLTTVRTIGNEYEKQRKKTLIYDYMDTE